MNDFMHYIATSFALIFVIEGLLYTLYPDVMRKMIALALITPARKLRIFGLVMVILGMSLVFLLRLF